MPQDKLNLIASLLRTLQWLLSSPGEEPKPCQWPVRPGRVWPLLLSLLLMPIHLLGMLLSQAFPCCSLPDMFFPQISMGLNAFSLSFFPNANFSMRPMLTNVWKGGTFFPWPIPPLYPTLHFFSSTYCLLTYYVICLLHYCLLPQPIRIAGPWEIFVLFTDASQVPRILPSAQYVFHEYLN